MDDSNSAQSKALGAGADVGLSASILESIGKAIGFERAQHILRTVQEESVCGGDYSPVDTAPSGRACGAQPSAYDPTGVGAFKNFHLSLCNRFGYTHDEVFWWRDLISLEEHIAGAQQSVGPWQQVLAEIIETDGGDGSKCFHALRLYDARQLALALLAGQQLYRCNGCSKLHASGDSPCRCGGILESFDLRRNDAKGDKEE